MDWIVFAVRSSTHSAKLLSGPWGRDPWGSWPLFCHLEKAPVMMISEGDAMVCLLNGLHLLCQANRPKFTAHRMHRLALSERMRILAQKAYDELLQERSAHGSLREVEIEALIARLRLKGMLEMVFDPDSKGLSGTSLEDFGNIFLKIVRSCDDQNLGVITSTTL